MTSRQRIALLDRDGVINVDTGYLCDPAMLQLAPGAVGGLRVLHDAGYLLVVVTNQSGIGRGYYDERDFVVLTGALDRLLHSHGVALTATYHCPHRPEAECECRKPSPGMLLRALKEWRGNAADAVMIGDKPSDIDAGVAAGISRTYLIDPAGELRDLYACAQRIAAEDRERAAA